MSEDLDEGFGFVVGARKELGNNEKFGWGLECVLSSAYSDLGTDANVDVNHINIGARFPGVDGPIEDAYDNPPFEGLVNVIAGRDGAMMAAQVDYNLDLSAYTFGVGLNSKLNVSKMFDLVFSIGPTLTYVKSDMSRTEKATYNAGANTLYRKTENADRSDVHFGAYGSAGLSFQFSQALAVEAGARYDWVADEYDAGLAEVELDGVSGEVKMIFSF
jgi:hypothetical protein